MDTVRMVSTSVHSWFGRRLKVGEEFDCTPELVDWMQRMGRARLKEQTYKTRDMTAERRTLRLRK